MTTNNSINLAKSLIALNGANADITSMTGLTGDIKAPTSIKDSNGNVVLNFTSAASAVNYLDISNAAALGSPTITAKGTDTNIGITLKNAASGNILFNSPVGTSAFGMVPNSDSNSFSAVFRITSITANRTYTFSDYSGTIPLLQFSSITAHSGGGQASATVITNTSHIVTSAAPGDSVKLPTSPFLMPYYLRNISASAFNLYPASGGQINALGADNPFSVAGSTSVIFIPVTSTQAYIFSAS